MVQLNKKFFQKISKFFLELLFPRFCLGCQKQGSYLCEDCLALIDLSSSYQKEKGNRALARLYFATDYNHFLVKRLIQHFKYPPFAKKLSQTLGFLIITYFQNLEKPPDFLGPDKEFVLVPIPLHFQRLKWRGFNPALEISRELSEFFRIPLSSESLIKTKKTLPQIDLTESQRKVNLKNAFVCFRAELIKGRKILLVDDVITTGSTINEAARVLKQAGAQEVWGIVVARD